MRPFKTPAVGILQAGEAIRAQGKWVIVEGRNEGREGGGRKGGDFFELNYTSLICVPLPRPPLLVLKIESCFPQSSAIEGPPFGVLVISVTCNCHS